MWRDAAVLLRRDVVLQYRTPAWLMIGLAQPVLYLLLFGPLLEPVVADTPAFPAADPWTILTPALAVMAALFTGSFAGAGLLTEQRAGLIERLRLTDAQPLGVLLGKVGANAVPAALQTLLLVALAGIAFGLRVSALELISGVSIVVALSVTLAAGSYALAFTLDDEAALPALLNLVLLPLVLLSGVLIPITEELSPGWLHALSRANPLTHVVDASRAAFGGELGAGDLLVALLLLATITVTSLWWAARCFERPRDA